MAAPLWMILSADKNIKKYQVVTSLIYALNFIGAYIFLKLGFAPYYVMVVRIIVYSIAIIARLILVKEKVDTFPIGLWVKDVVLRSLCVAIIPFVYFYLINDILIQKKIFELIFKAGSVFLITGIAIFFLGLKNEEKQMMFKIIKNKFCR